MEGLFPRSFFCGFGPSLFDAVAVPHVLIYGPRSSRLRRQVREVCPRQPGIYGMLDRSGRILYVGKAKSLRARLLTYFRPKSRDPKAGHILRHARAIVWEPLTNEFAALLRELELIRRWRPRFNVQGQPHRRRSTYLCVGRQPAPYVFVAANPPARVLACYGPLPVGKEIRSAARHLNDAFALRDCPQKQEMVFADQQELFPLLRAAGCIRHEIGTCLGPCAAAVTRAGYGQRVDEVRAFLEGRNRSLLEGVQKEMTEAAAAQRYERAAMLRDRLQPLEWLCTRLDRLHKARKENTFVYPVRGENGDERWYLIHQGRVGAALRPPRTLVEGQEAAQRIEVVFGSKHPSGSALGTSEIDGILLVSAWFRKHPEERDRVMTPSEAHRRALAVPAGVASAECVMPPA